jgi:hypothetical protein
MDHRARTGKQLTAADLLPLATLKVRTSVTSTDQIIAAIKEIAPPGIKEPDAFVIRKLSDQTARLHEALPYSAEEYIRFTTIQKRELDVPLDELEAWLSGRVVVVTGGTGCIGSVLLEQIRCFSPKRLVSVSRGSRKPWRTVRGVEYAYADVCDEAALRGTLTHHDPSVIFHCAAQRDPGQAEIQVTRTVATNLLGADNVIAAAVCLGVSHLIYASTGKTLRYYTPDIYAASKKAAESLISLRAPASEISYSAGRFTHVVDNSLIIQYLRKWCDEGLLRLHDPYIAFYVQSAIESAQLLLCAGLASTRGSFRISAIRDLGIPVDLLRLALGAAASWNPRAAIWFCGFGKGYEEAPYPGLYDPQLSGDVSPLISGLEARDAEPGFSDQIDTFCPRVGHSERLTEKYAILLNSCRESENDETIQKLLDEFSWDLLEVIFQSVPVPALQRTLALIQPGMKLDPESQRIYDAIRRSAGSDSQ